MLILLAPRLGSSLKVSLLPILIRNSSSRRTVTIERSRWGPFPFPAIATSGARRETAYSQAGAAQTQRASQKCRNAKNKRVSPFSFHFLVNILVLVPSLSSCSFSSKFFKDNILRHRTKLIAACKYFSRVVIFLDQNRGRRQLTCFFCFMYPPNKPPNHQPIQPFEERPQPAACAICIMII